MGGADVTGGGSQECDRHDGGPSDAGHRRQMGFGTKRAAQEHGEDRSDQGQERYEHQQR